MCARRHHHCFLLPFLIASITTTTTTTKTTVFAVYQQQPKNPLDNPMMKAWHCHGRSQRDLVDRLRQAQIIKSPAVQRVMEQIDRKNYVGSDILEDDSNVSPYQDTPLGIGKMQTISAPHMHAHVLEEMLPTLQQNGNRHDHTLKVLDVGCGSGYLTAALGRWFQAKPTTTTTTSSATASDADGTSILPFPGKVYGMDIHPELVQFTRENMAKSDGDLLDSGMVSLRHGNGWLGWPEAAPFDAIHVGAAASSFPMELARQLTVHGVLIVPVGPNGGVQTLLRVERVHKTTTNTETTSADRNKNNDNDNFVWEDFHVTQLLGVRYVPLVQRPN